MLTSESESESIATEKKKSGWTRMTWNLSGSKLSAEHQHRYDAPWTIVTGCTNVSVA